MGARIAIARNCMGGVRRWVGKEGGEQVAGS